MSIGVRLTTHSALELRGLNITMNIEIKSLRRAALWALALAALSACSDRSAVSATATLAPQSTVGGSTDPLPPEQAFPLKVEALDATTLLVQFTPAPDHYLYKSKISFALNDAAGARLHAAAMPAGVPKKDPFLGDQEVYRQPVRISLPLAREAGKPAKFTLVATYQGCNERIGLCYSPIDTSFDFSLP
ncbi:MAG: protein-disulfide reductase DsbD N-terminal domain-containing protein [Burkholderiaceae bacterium]|nr:protein-disulfide reductase DsbD N-terminal domain-containing protein [Burkholderiaceae bacterium]